VFQFIKWKLFVFFFLSPIEKFLYFWIFYLEILLVPKGLHIGNELEMKGLILEGQFYLLGLTTKLPNSEYEMTFCWVFLAIPGNWRNWGKLAFPNIQNRTSWSPLGIQIFWRWRLEDVMLYSIQIFFSCCY
jgi:hypothetical protein